MTFQFSRIPAAAVLDPRLPAEACRVLGMLGIYADHAGRCSPSLATMTALLGITRPWVQRQLRMLEAKGYVVVERRSAGAAGTTYRLVCPSSTNRLAAPDSPALGPPDHGGADPIWRFLDACTAKGGRVQADQLYRAYVRWCQSSGQPPRTSTFFGRYLAGMEIPKMKVGVIFYTGLQLDEAAADGRGGAEGFGQLDGFADEETGCRSSPDAAARGKRSKTVQPSRTVQSGRR